MHRSGIKKWSKLVSLYPIEGKKKLRPDADCESPRQGFTTQGTGVQREKCMCMNRKVGVMGGWAGFVKGGSKWGELRNMSQVGSGHKHGSISKQADFDLKTMLVQAPSSAKSWELRAESSALYAPVLKVVKAWFLKRLASGQKWRFGPFLFCSLL